MFSVDKIGASRKPKFYQSLNAQNSLQSEGMYVDISKPCLRFCVMTSNPHF